MPQATPIGDESGSIDESVSVPSAVPLIRRKLEPPALSSRLVARPRVDALIETLLERHPIVCIYATPGAGKTTAAVQAVGRLGRPVAWLSVDDTDSAPGRLLTYLEAALGRAVPSVTGVVAPALTAGVSHSEAAGLLAETIGTTPVVLVLDELERIADSPEALAVLGAFLRYLPPTAGAVLISRRDLPIDVGSTVSLGHVAGVGETDLAFRVDEAAEALAGATTTGLDATAAVEATGGWVAGVLFEAWRSAEHRVGMGGEADPLYGYLSSQILEQLPEADREFLVVTSVLPHVSTARAAALGRDDAGERLASLRTRHLPVSWEDEGRTMRCHSRFREYLVELLERRGVERSAAVRRAYGRLLLAEGHAEDATEQLLAAAAVDEALVAAERAIRGVIERLDLDVAERWLEQLAAVDAGSGRRLAEAELMLAIVPGDFRRGVRVADQLTALGERARLAGSSGTAASMMAWCFLHAGRVHDVRAVLEEAGPAPEVEAMRYCLPLLVGDAGDEDTTPPLTGGPLDALVLRIHYYRGRLRDLEVPPSSRWAEQVAEPFRIGALRAMGRVDEALRLLESAGTEGAGSLWTRAVLAPELMCDLGRRDDAWHELVVGREETRARGSEMLGMMSFVLEAKLELRLNRDPEAALAAVARFEAHPASADYRYVGEFADTWAGFALLLAGDDDGARARLRRAVDGMVRGRRILELPTAAVYLAEAEWRAGDEEAADQAADLALDAARDQGSNHILLQALADFPAVVSRRLDAEPAGDSPWHEIGRALRAQGVPLTTPATARIVLEEFGRLRLLLDGRALAPKIGKSAELVAYLAFRAAYEVEKEELLGALFAGRTDASARSYLRQAVRWVRDVLPPEASLASEGPRIRLEGVELVAESRRFEQSLAEASRLQGEQRYARLRGALEIALRGEFLSDVRSAWAERRRQELIERTDDARLQAADLAFVAGRYREVEAFATAVLERDRFREAAWRLLMRTQAALGDDDRVIATYVRCEKSLAEVGAAPSETTRRLLAGLRR